MPFGQIKDRERETLKVNDELSIVFGTTGPWLVFFHIQMDKFI